MTDIDNMPVGDELDAMVAAAIGWTDWQKLGGTRYPVAEDTLHDEWSPSRNIAHVWQALERLRARRLFLGLLPEADGTWLAVQPGAVGTAVIASAPTAPLAICRAILKVTRA